MAEWKRRGASMLPVADQVPVAGSYTSAEALSTTLASEPPATSTLPPGSRVAVWEARPVPRPATAVHVPVAGS